MTLKSPKNLNPPEDLTTGTIGLALSDVLTFVTMPYSSRLYNPFLFSALTNKILALPLQI
jgi:hypothetical protein